MKYIHTDSDLPIENTYPKLVRDKIPEIIKANGQQADIRFLTDDQEFLEYLFLKLIEEATELRQAKSPEHQIEELADVSEVIESILATLNISRMDISKVQDQKRRERSSFTKRILMLVKP